MKYFIRNENRIGSAYIEFSKGNWDGAFNHEDSIYISPFTLMNTGFCDAIKSVYPEFDVDEISEVNKKQWNKIKASVKEIGGEVLEAFNEADEWVQENFVSSDVFMILGY